MSAFVYDESIFAKYPATVGGVIIAHGLHNGKTPPALWSAYTAEQQAVLAKIGSKPLSEIESLAAWRRVFSSFGVDPTQYRSAAEALLRRLTKQGNIPSINTLVDMGNMVSIRYGLPVAVLDSAQVADPLTVRFANGTESFTTLGQNVVERPEVGEVIFADANALVYARRWCWRQSAQSAAQPSTTQAIITVEAHHKTGREAVQAAVNDLLNLLKMYAGATSLTSAILDQNTQKLTDKE
jgi:DNA/RNA-binding domain of Phe-tRNA-synthetase-like protein